MNLIKIKNGASHVAQDGVREHSQVPGPDEERPVASEKSL